jgi:type II secretory pathway component PulF
LSKNLSFLAAENKKSNELKRKILSAVLYPAVIALGALAITLFLLLYVFPKVLPIFASFNKQLPVSTKVIIFFSNFLSGYFLVILVLGGVVTAGLTKYFWNNIKIKYLIHKVCLRIPMFGYLFKLYLLTNITRLLAQLLSRGIPLVETLKIVSGYIPNLYYTESFIVMAERINDGLKFSANMNRYKDLYPAELISMVASGESSGNLAGVLAYLSTLYEEELNVYLEDLPRLIEPILLLFTGLAVGFIALAIIQPIYSIVQSIKP